MAGLAILAQEQIILVDTTWEEPSTQDAKAGLFDGTYDE